MRWITKTKTVSPRIGDRKVVKRFLFVPTKIGKETRWMEFAHIELECVKRIVCGGEGTKPYESWSWWNRSWHNA